MQKLAVIIYGPPGSGKGTQAELLERKYNFIHFDTGRHIESLVLNPSLQKNPIIKRERKIFESGKLNTPSWVLGIVKNAVEKIAKVGFSVIFSGSPRTVFEALGDKNRRGLLAVLTKLYGRKNIFIIKLKVRDSISIKRNSARFVCSVCGLPVLAKSRARECAFCAGPLRKRVFDNPELIRVRIKEYEDRTLPIVREAKKLDIKLVEVNGEPAPYKVHKQIVKKLKLK